MNPLIGNLSTNSYTLNISTLLSKFLTINFDLKPSFNTVEHGI